MNDKQKMYDAVMIQARGMIFSDIGFDTAVKNLGAGNPVEQIGYTAAMTAKAVKGGYEQRGKQVPGQILGEAFKEIVGDLVEIAVAAKLVHPDDKVETAKEALHIGGKVFASSKAKPGMVQQARAQ